MYDYELDEQCTEELHLRMVAKWVAPATSGLAPPPPPPPLPPVVTWATHINWRPVAPRPQTCAAELNAACADTCEDTCTFSSDEFCDDGGPGSEYSLCPMNTDCSDCGAPTGLRGCHLSPVPSKPCAEAIQTYTLSGCNLLSTRWGHGCHLLSAGGSTAIPYPSQLRFIYRWVWASVGIHVLRHFTVRIVHRFRSVACDTA